VDVREARFRAKVERRGEHEVWTGSKDAFGTGQVRIDGKLRTVQRAAWEFAHGSLDPGERVLACPDEKACVRIEHLSLAPRSLSRTRTKRRRRGTGSMRELRPGVWRLTVSDGVGPDGKARRRHLTFHGDEAGAAQRLADLVETTRGPTRLGDLRVRELVDRYLFWLGDDEPDTASLRSLAERLIDPHVGREFAALLDAHDVRRVLEDARVADVRSASNLLDDAYAWAQARGLTRRNPLEGGIA
jgi:hypothetical protein